MVSQSSELEDDLKDIGNKLLHNTSSIVQLLALLDKAENILSRVEQAPSRSVEDAMLPVMKALIRPELIGHSEIDVKASVASCLHEIMRITAPDAPYDEKVMEKIFELTVMLFHYLYLDAGHCYSKAVSILDNMANVRSCLVMLDIEVDELIVEMFQLLFKIIRPHHRVSVFLAIETIMTLVTDEIEEIPFELISRLLLSLRKENQDASGGNSIVAPTKEPVPEATGHGNDSPIVDGPSKSVINNSSPQVDDTQTPVEKKSVKTLEGSVSKTGDLIRAIRVISMSTAHGEDKSASPSQNHSFLEGSHRKRGRPKKNKDQLNLDVDDSKESSGKKKVSFSASRSENENETRPMKSCKTNGKRKHSQQKQKMSGNFGEELIGRRIKVWWPMDETFYESVIYSYNLVEKKHRVLHADGEEELLNLCTETWEFVGEGKYPDQDDASETVDDEEHRENGKLKTRKSIDKKKTKSIDRSKLDKNKYYGETGSSDRHKKKKKK